MPEGMNVEISQKLSEQAEAKQEEKDKWSGYQAAPDYKTAFVAWWRTDPFTNPAAPPGPGYMPQYHNQSFESADQLNALASATFDQGTAARDTAERYVRDTVLYASVLFLIAIAQRFNVRLVRMATTAVALSLAAYTTFAMLTLPRI
jgi:hypothetical protein